MAETSRKTNQNRTPITNEERQRMIQMRTGTPKASVSAIAIACNRGRETVRLVLRDAGLMRPGENTVPAEVGLARDTSPIKLVGFSDPLRIDWYRRKFGADRVRVVPPCTAPASIRAERANG